MPRRSRLWAMAALVALGLAAYANFFDDAFQFDDIHAIVDNSFLRSPRNIPRFFRDGTTLDSLPSNQAYRPLLAASFAVDYWLSGGVARPLCFHVTTLALFLAQALLMLSVYRRLFAAAGDGRRPRAIFVAAWLAAAWYLVNPANAETIDYVCARSDSLAALFVVAAFAVYLAWPRARRYHLYLLPIVLGALVKPTALMFWPLLPIYQLLFEQELDLTQLPTRAGLRKLAAALRASLPALLVCAAMFALTQAMTPATFTTGGGPRLPYLLSQPHVLAHYFGSFFLPLWLSADSDWTPLARPDASFFAGLSFLALLVAAIVVASRRRAGRPIVFGLAWFLVAHLPTTLTPMAEVLNDHRMFLPNVGLAMAAGWALFLAWQRVVARAPGLVPALWATVLVALGACVFGTHVRNQVWRSDESLWRDVADKSPRNGRGLMNYGLAKMARGDFAGAEVLLERALALTPNYAYVEINLGVNAAALRRPADAERHFQRALALAARDPEAHYYYARFLFGQERRDEARRQLQTALALAPAHLPSRELLALLDRAPSPAELLQQSSRYYELGRFADSIAAARQALAAGGESSVAYNNLCAAYASLRQWRAAVEAGERAVALDGANALARRNLAWARAGLAGSTAR